MKRMLLMLGAVVMLTGCGGIRGHDDSATAPSMNAVKASEAHVMAVSVMDLDADGHPVEAVKVIMQLPDGLTADATTEGEVNLTGLGMLTMGSLHGRELCIMSLAPGGFHTGTDMFKMKVFGDAALVNGIKVTYVHACGSIGTELYDAPACSLASVKFRIE